ncbi:MAG: glycosyltransferase [Flavobacteriaceae bacterium]|nr:glycosyltransferase [Flavobacteriaceae bacterium]
MKLVIISHTEHYKLPNGTIVGWGPTINELNHLAKKFEEIKHIAMLREETAPPSALPYNASNIKFIPLPPLGGKTLASKLKIIFTAPKIISIIKEELQSADVFQLRTPTGIGVFLIPYLTLFSKKKGWYKYAGNWNQENPPLGYRLQRWMLKKQKQIVTINGKWENQPKQCITFENPCLTVEEYNLGKTIISEKKYQVPFSFCFVGRLEKPKGVERIIEAFSNLTPEEKKNIAQIDFVGDGTESEYFKKIASESGMPMNFHGFLPRNKVFELYKNSHFFLLPSTASEGFPKVIAEAMNYGCIPIVSNVSSIGQYINNENGYIVSPTTSEKLNSILSEIIKTEEEILKQKAVKGRNVSQYFTFENYNYRILKEVIPKTK